MSKVPSGICFPQLPGLDEGMASRKMHGRMICETGMGRSRAACNIQLQLESYSTKWVQKSSRMNTLDMFMALSPIPVICCPQKCSKSSTAIVPV